MQNVQSKKEPQLSDLSLPIMPIKVSPRLPLGTISTRQYPFSSKAFFAAT